MLYQFTKMQGTGNDFVIFNTFSHPLLLSCEQIKHIADRRLGIGCDQVLLLEPPKNNETDVYYRIFNSDGTEVTQCGNGARCIANYLNNKGLVKKNSIIAETKTSQLILKINNNSVTVNMGIPEFEPADIPLNISGRLENYSFSLGDEEIIFGAVSIGNPHAVIIVDDVESASVESIGAAIQEYGVFPKGVNVGFVQILDRKTIKLRVYERGVGETLACGSGACAAAVISCQQGYLGDVVEVKLRGGCLKIHWAGEGEPVYMNGSVSAVYEGEIEL
jgi:diaminopimelate epimerase